MPTFLAVYRGRTIGEARMVAVSAEPGLVAEVVDRLLDHPQMDDDDPVVRAIDSGRVTALRLIKREHSDDHA
jgi:hypothetical protein